MRSTRRVAIDDDEIDAMTIAQEVEERVSYQLMDRAISLIEQSTLANIRLSQRLEAVDAPPLPWQVTYGR